MSFEGMAGTAGVVRALAPSAVVDRAERPTLECLGQLVGQAGPVGQHPGRDAARVRHDAGPVAGD